MASLVPDPYSMADIAIRSFVLLLLTAGFVFALRRRSASVVHGIWAAGLGGCLAIPIVMLLSPNWSLALLPPDPSADFTTPASAGMSSPATGSIARAPIGHRRPLAHEPSPTAEPTTAVPAAPENVGQSEGKSWSNVTSHFKWPSLATLAMAIWVAGVFVMLLRLLQQTIAVQRRVNQASNLHDADWSHQRDAAAELLGLQRNVELKRHAESLSPMVVGMMKPVVLLPHDADTWSHERRNLVLLHELAHVQRRDVLTQTMAALACAVYWFNPLAWWGAYQMKRLREIACDDAVVTHSGAAASYAQTLLDVAKRYRCRPMTSAIAMARSSNVEGRIKSILSSTRSRAVLSNRSVRCLAVAALVVAAFVGTCQLSSRANDSTEKEPDQAVAEEPQELDELHDTESRTMVVRVLDEAGEPLPGASV